jgi:hypothetical protein
VTYPFFCPPGAHATHRARASVQRLPLSMAAASTLQARFWSYAASLGLERCSLTSVMQAPPRQTPACPEEFDLFSSLLYGLFSTTSDSSASQVTVFPWQAYYRYFKPVCSSVLVGQRPLLNYIKQYAANLLSSSSSPISSVLHRPIFLGLESSIRLSFIPTPIQWVGRGLLLLKLI